jgi:hypothetical protein
MPDDYTIGKLKGECVLVYRDSTGKRRRYRLGTADASEARRLAPAIYAERTRPEGTKVKDLWEAYTLDKAGRPVGRHHGAHLEGATGSFWRNGGGGNYGR